MSNNIATTSTSPDVSPLRFHANHGKYIRINQDGTIARRTNTNFFTRGLVFSSRPIGINEKISFKLLEVTDNLGGFIYVGFTSKNPELIKDVTCSNLANKPGYWSWFFPKNLCNRNSTLFYYISEAGEVHYGSDNGDHGVFGGNIKINCNLWALIDIFGNSNAIKFVEPPPERLEVSLKYQSSKLEFVPLLLHSTHGRFVKINKNIVHRIDAKYNQGYVFTKNPLSFNELVVIHISPNHQTRFQGYIHLGVTSCDPALLNQDELPDNVNLLVDRGECWILICDFTNLNCGDEISLSMTQNGQIHFKLNGQKFGGVVHVDHTVKLWLFINIYGSTQPIYFMTCSQHVNDDKKDIDKECMVCYENFIDTALYRCGHMCMCYDCAIQQWQGKGHGHCPLCRAVIKDVIRINK